MNHLTNIFLLLILLFTSSCELYEQEEFVEEYFVEAFLVAGEPLDRVQLSTTASFEESYSKSDSRISGAEGTIFKLDGDGNRVEAYLLDESGSGRYSPAEELIPQPRTTYELQIITHDRQTLRAYTTIPDTFSVAETIRDKATYQSEEQVQVKLTQSWFPDRQNIFIFETKALAPDEYPMTPYYYTENASNRRARQRQRSDIVTQGNFELNEDGTFTLNYPWSEISWFGPSEVTIHAICDNIYDYYRSQYTQIGGTSLAPGQIENTISNVEGGRGLFGGLSGVTFEIFIETPPGYNSP